MAHALLGGVVAELSGGSAAAGATGAVTGELATPAIALALYGTADSDKLSPDQKANLSALATLASGIAAGVSSGSTAGAATGALAGKNAVENNFLSSTSSEKSDALAEKVLKGDKSLQTAKDFLQLENADKRSDALVAKFNKEPAELSTAERTELVSYLKIYASDMQAKYGEAVTKELIAGMLTGQDYMKSAPQTEAQQKAQTIMNTWGYHKSNASIGDPVLLFGSSVLGTTIKEGMALNAAIGVGVNTGVKLSGNDPFSYVDAILAGVTAAATTGKSWQASAAINMGGAAIGSAIKGEDPTNSVISTGFGSAAGSLGGKVVDSLSPVTDQVTKDVIGAVTGSTASELTGKAVKDELDKREKKQ
ncbi:VENN motif pre-toxin domain-containing protein [Pantoea ananatis]|uniref:VENN motif pre-toxin domain-containing protein n=1 Tax=Pantoea ananas TaxID=553 RepID=UPI001E4C3E1E|nr:VENN motif pre-toxin domain-containing protein [Pantoea ananatis]